MQNWLNVGLYCAIQFYKGKITSSSVQSELHNWGIPEIKLGKNTTCALELDQLAISDQALYNKYSDEVSSLYLLDFSCKQNQLLLEWSVIFGIYSNPASVVKVVFVLLPVISMWQKFSPVFGLGLCVHKEVYHLVTQFGHGVPFCNLGFSDRLCTGNTAFGSQAACKKYYFCIGMLRTSSPIKTY